MLHELEPIAGPAAWHGAEMARRTDWIHNFDDAQRDDVEAALASLECSGTPGLAFGAAEFPLPRTRDLLEAVRRELEGGTGLVRLRGLDVDRYSEDALRRIFWGIGCHLGIPLYQNPTGEIVGEVHDETRLAVPSFTRDAPGGVASSRARSRSNGPLRFHTDLCDVIALLCVRNACAGGVSKIASSVTIHNEILKRRPDLAKLLFEDYWRARPSDSEAGNVSRVYKLPVFGFEDGKFTSQYSRTFVELAQQDPSVPRITTAQDEALDLLAEVAEEVCLHSPFEKGDIQLLNNHVTYHGRTAYDDDAATRQDRLLFRLWLATPDSRRLPSGFRGAVGCDRIRRRSRRRDAAGRRTPLAAAAGRLSVRHVIDLECNLPAGEENADYREMLQGPPGNPVADRMQRPEGYGFDNYQRIFRNRTEQYKPVAEAAPGERMQTFIADMDRAGVEIGVIGASNDTLKRICPAYPDRFVGLAAISPLDGMRGVREFERLVREHGIGGLRVVALYNSIPASDRRYYPLYAKCVELDVPVRIYTSMNYANDRPYDLGHPRHLDCVAIDFPELRIVAGLSGWPWISDMVGLLRRHPNLYADTAAHRPRHFATSGSGWEQFLQFGNTLLQDKIMVGLSRGIFGVPFEALIGEYQALPLKDSVKEKWLYGNALTFLRRG